MPAWKLLVTVTGGKNTSALIGSPTWYRTSASNETLFLSHCHGTTRDIRSSAFFSDAPLHFCKQELLRYNGYIDSSVKNQTVSIGTPAMKTCSLEWFIHAINFVFHLFGSSKLTIGISSHCSTSYRDKIRLKYTGIHLGDLGIKCVPRTSFTGKTRRQRRFLQLLRYILDIL